MSTILRARGVVAVLAILCAGPALAGDPPKPEAANPLFSGKTVSPVDLSRIAGREDTTQVSQAEQNATVTRNSVGDNAVTGSSTLDGNAFQNMSGLSILNVNTGNNVAINAAMNVNISITPPQ